MLNEARLTTDIPHFLGLGSEAIQPCSTHQLGSSGSKVTGASTKLKWPDWESALAGISNSAIVSYFEQELAANRESYLPKRMLRYRLSGKRRWNVSAHNKNAYVWQMKRFTADVEYWKKRLSIPDEVKPVKKDRCLRFFLHSEKDFQTFHNCVTSDLQGTEWADGPLEDELELSDASD